jgi:hypothetical protein
MKNVMVSLFLTTATFVAGQSAPAADKHADQQAIIQQRDALLKAYDIGDIKTLDQIEDDDFTLATEGGQITKQQHLDMVRKREQPQQVTRKIENQFRMYGDVVLLTEVDHASSPGGNADYQTTTVWVRHGNTWRITHMHFSRISP